jgi:hypothetical protein
VTTVLTGDVRVRTSFLISSYCIRPLCSHGIDTPKSSPPSRDQLISHPLPTTRSPTKQNEGNSSHHSLGFDSAPSPWDRPPSSPIFALPARSYPPSSSRSPSQPSPDRVPVRWVLYSSTTGRTARQSSSAHERPLDPQAAAPEEGNNVSRGIAPSPKPGIHATSLQ